MRIPFESGLLRPYRLSDAPGLPPIANNEKVARHLRDLFPHPYALEDATAWVEHCQDEGQLNWAIEVQDELVGGIGLVPQEDVYRLSAEIGYWLGEPYWGRGIATAAVGALTRHAINHLGFERLFAGVFESNHPSRRVLEKNGYVLEGRKRRAVIKGGVLLDEWLYAFVKGLDGSSNPSRNEGDRESANNPQVEAQFSRNDPQMSA